MSSVASRAFRPSSWHAATGPTRAAWCSGSTGASLPFFPRRRTVDGAILPAITKGGVMPEISWLAVVVGAVASFLLGGLWYSPVLFGKAWQRETGLTDEQLKSGNMARIF